MTNAGVGTRRGDSKFGMIGGGVIGLFLFEYEAIYGGERSAPEVVKKP